MIVDFDKKSFYLNDETTSSLQIFMNVGHGG